MYLAVPLISLDFAVFQVEIDLYLYTRACWEQKIKCLPADR